MPKLTLLSRISDGLPLAASMEDEKDHRELDGYKAQAKKLLKTMSNGTPARVSVESGGSVFQCAAMCPCFDMHFDILKPGSEAPVGAVDKIFNGCEELMLNVNKFRILFPEDATNEQKCLLVGAVMLLDFCYFEKEKNNNNNSGAPAGEKTAAAR